MKVSLGPTSLAGFGVSLLAVIPLVVKLLESGLSANHLGSPEQVSSLIALVSFGLTLIGRHLQSIHLIKAGK